MPKVSVLMPVYKTNEKYLKEAIDSILKQTYKDFELIILEDCPEDDREAIVKSYDDTRIKYIKNEKNMGIAFSRNRLISIAKGEYIAMADSDDISYSLRLEKQVSYLDEHKDVSLVGAWYECFPQSAKIAEFPENVSLLDMLKWCAIAQPCVMFRKSDFENKQLKYDNNFITAEDYDLWCRALMCGCKLSNIQEVLLKYRVHPNSVSHTKNKQTFLGASKVQNKIVTCLTEDKSLQKKLLESFTNNGALRIEKVVYLFNIIPFIKIKIKDKIQKWKLFNLFPIVKIKETNK